MTRTCSISRSENHLGKRSQHRPSQFEISISFEVQNNFVFKKKSSDHSIVYITLDNKKGVSGSERETIDEELTLDPEIQREIVQAMKKTYATNKSEVNKWTESQATIKDILAKHTAAKKRRTKEEIKIITAKLDLLNTRHATKGATDSSTCSKLERTYQKQLYELQHPEVLREPSIQEARSMYEKSEVCSKAMFSTYKSRANQQWINSIKKANWEEGKEPIFNGATQTVSEVGGEFVKLYKIIFAEKEISGEEWLLEGLKEHRIVKASRRMLDEPFTKDEVARVMENLPVGKQAGPNRVPGGLFKRMVTVFAEPFADMINEASRTGTLPKHFLEGDISMLYKKGDREDPRNYRPITLLNSDYKIYTRVLAHRMAKVVHEFVAECQKGFVPDTFIAEATMLTRLIEGYTNEDGADREGIMLFLDMEKAFDRVSYAFTLRGLESLGFGKKIRKWVGMMYNTNNAPKRIMYVNGYYSDWFTIKKRSGTGLPTFPAAIFSGRASVEVRYLLREKAEGNTSRNEELQTVTIRGRHCYLPEEYQGTEVRKQGHREVVPGYRNARKYD